jgi:succinate dehydrogenase hydrophobic anchor subunit
MRLGMSEIFEDYIHEEKVKKLLNTLVLMISVIIPVAAIVSMVILGL